MAIKLPPGFCRKCGARIKKKLKTCEGCRGVSKYRAVQTVVGGVRFASKHEAWRHGVLVMMLRAGVITNLRTQVPYPLVVNGVHVCDYVADAVYDQDGETIVEDSKGYRTREYLLKYKLFFAVYGFKIREA